MFPTHIVIESDINHSFKKGQLVSFVYGSQFTHDNGLSKIDCADFVGDDHPTHVQTLELTEVRELGYIVEFAWTATHIITL